MRGHVCHPRSGEVPGLLHRRAAHESARAAAPRRDFLHTGARARLPRSGHPHRRADPHVRAAGRRAPVPYGRGGDRGRVQENPAGVPEYGRSGGRNEGGPPVLHTAPRHATKNLRRGPPRAAERRPRRAEDRRVHKHRGDLPHHRRDCVRDRPRVLEAEGVQPTHPRGVPAGVAHLARLRPPAGGPRRAHPAREVLPPLHRALLQEGPPRADVPGDAAVEPVDSGAAAEEARHRRPSALRLHGPPRARDPHARARAPQLPRGPRRRWEPDADRRAHVRVPPGPPAGQDAHRLPRVQVLQRGAVHHGDAVGAERVHAPARRAEGGG
mmetsp:Transcript_20058/g.43897  ORF Transcript_20058/g.43897 Transcript_20058/m.43897 type:complete len:325 (+) Transcript_20058:776-1750(+)